MQYNANGGPITEEGHWHFNWKRVHRHSALSNDTALVSAPSDPLLEVHLNILTKSFGEQHPPNIFKTDVESISAPSPALQIVDIYNPLAQFLTEQRLLSRFQHFARLIFWKVHQSDSARGDEAPADPRCVTYGTNFQVLITQRLQPS